MPYVPVYDESVGFVPTIGFRVLGDFPQEEELEEFHSPSPPEREHWEGLLNGAKFDDQTAARVWDIIVFSTELLKHTPIGKIPKATIVVIGTLGQLLKLAGKNPWLRKPIGRYIEKTFGPVIGPIAERVGLRSGGRKLDRLGNVPAVKNNPVYKSVVGTGAMASKSMSLQNRLMVLGQKIDLDVDVDLQELDRFLRRENSQGDFESRGPASEEQEFDMAYGQRRGYRAWVPYHIWKRRQGQRRYGGNSRGGYRSGGYSSRRSYRRW